jgi:hypothetical protein
MADIDEEIIEYLVHIARTVDEIRNDIRVTRLEWHLDLTTV